MRTRNGDHAFDINHVLFQASVNECDNNHDDDDIAYHLVHD